MSSKSAFVLAAACVFAGLLARSSSSQDGEPAQRGIEGRYQLVIDPRGSHVIFDTRTARGWVWGRAGAVYPGMAILNKEEWKPISSPFHKDKDDVKSPAP